MTINGEIYEVENNGLLRSQSNRILYKQEISEVSGTPILAPQIEIIPEADNYPLGKYGRTLMKYMEENYNDRFWELTLEGTLMKKLHEREEQLSEMKLSFMEQIERTNPRPITDEILVTARHMEWIAQQAEEMVREELYQPI
ncbi:TnpV protein [Paludicola sp. MB14-C6]|uniref:TnpV protein n=1 Tax=Paludihabitans sp. MB14-C6 TaxID=3070656 RepID=UPI0035A29A76